MDKAQKMLLGRRRFGRGNLAKGVVHFCSLYPLSPLGFVPVISKAPFRACLCFLLKAALEIIWSFPVWRWVIFWRGPANETVSHPPASSARAKEAIVCAERPTLTAEPCSSMVFDLPARSPKKESEPSAHKRRRACLA